MADRIFWLFSERDIRCAAACSLRVRGTLARALAAASASRRDGVAGPCRSAGRSRTRGRARSCCDGTTWAFSRWCGTPFTLPASPPKLLLGEPLSTAPCIGLRSRPRVRVHTGTRGRPDPMSLWQRITMLFRSKANKALDRAEDPREMLDYSYQRQTELLVKVRRGVADVATSRK